MKTRTSIFFVLKDELNYLFALVNKPKSVDLFNFEIIINKRGYV